MDMITRQGANCFYWISQISYDYGLIENDVFENRMNFLKKMIYLNQEISQEKLHFSPKDLPDEKNNDDSIIESHMVDQGTYDSSEGKYFPVKTRGNPWLYFRAKGVLKNWYFHKCDPDPNPSVPHGHYNKKNPKLDPYTGCKYSTNDNEVGRIPVKYIIALWNDSKFRKFSLESISWYMNEFPNYEWRVNNPLKLPSKK